MSIIKTYMVPHPPLIIPNIGKGEEQQIKKTIESYESIAKEIGELNPDTIIISSPHAPMYSDYFYISSKTPTKGDFSRFGAKEVSFEEDLDLELIDEIWRLSEEQNHPAGPVKIEENLDHGTMVPLYFIRKYLKDCKLVIVGLSTLPLVDNYKMGQIIKEAVSNLNKKVVYVASGDLSHKLQEYGPYGFVKEGPEYDKKIMDVCSKANFEELFNFDSTFLEKAAECGHRSFTIMAGVLDGQNVESKELSHEDITGVGYGICSFTPKEENEERKFLQKHLKDKKENIKREIENSDEYVKLARQTIENYIKYNKIIEIPSNTSEELLNNKAGVFVSIHKHDTLRGCIGTTGPTTPSIANEIINNAISAATKDPRFPEITPEELEWLEIKVDVLEAPEKITSPNELDVKKYGVIVRSGFKSGLLLPDLDGIETVEQQVSIAMRKGNISKTDNYTLERFKVIRHR